MPFDFEAAVQAPFRMQPGLRRLAAGQPQLTPLAPGSRHQREKMAVLLAYREQALQQVAGFDPGPALKALAAQAAAEHPTHWRWDGARAEALTLGAAVRGEVVEQTAPGRFGNGDEIARCLQGLPGAWRLAGLLSLGFAEDFAIVDGGSGTIPWLAVCLPSHWAPEDKVGRHFAEVHAPVADNRLLLQASASLLRLVTGPERWERFVWTVTDHPRLHAHPQRVAQPRWAHTAPAQAWWRTERQTFIPLPALGQAIFTIEVDVVPLAEALSTAERAQTLHDAMASMSPAVLAYRALEGVQAELLAWLQERARSLRALAPTP